MSRRRGSATALKASEVVEARGMVPIYAHMGICQEESLVLLKKVSADFMRLYDVPEDPFLTRLRSALVASGRGARRVTLALETSQSRC
jgi:hypothetical protein